MKRRESKYTAEAQRRRADEGDELMGPVIAAAIEVHRALGPGLLERVYEECLCYELRLRRVSFARQVVIDLNYKELRVGAAYRMDVVVEGRLVLEIKTVDDVLPIHEAQLLTYLRVGRYPIGLILNFKVPVLVKGIVRIALHQD